MPYTDPHLGITADHGNGEDDWDLAYNRNMEVFRSLLMANVLSILDTPVTPTNGDFHIVGTTPTGDFVGQENKLAYFRTAAWYFVTPKNGHRIYNAGSGIYLRFTGTVWVDDNVVIINAHTGISHTLVISDSNNKVNMNNAAANTLNIPTNASVPFSIGAQIIVEQKGAGQTTITGAGVTLRSAGGLVALSSQYSLVALIKEDTDTWVLSGDLS